MSEIKNTDLLNAILKALYITAARRTTHSFAVAVIESIIRIIGEKYDFLKYVQININYGSEDFVDISSELNNIHPVKIGKVIEAIVQIVCLDLKDKAGHYFIREVKLNSGEKIISKLKECGVDFELLLLQQQYLYLRQKKKEIKPGVDNNREISDKQSLDNISLLGYSQDNISSWNYDSESKICIIYDKNGKELDRLNLDTIIRFYIGTLTNEGVIVLSRDNEEKADRIEISEKEFELLKMLYARDVDIATAIDILKVSEMQLNLMVHRLLKLEMLYYSSHDEVALTKTGINHLESLIKNKKIL